MKKLIVRILNLVYLVGVALSVVSIWKKPILNLNVGITVPKDKIGELLSDAIPTETETKAIKREEISDSKSDFDLTSMLTPEKISEAFENDLSFTIELKVPAETAFDLKNDQALQGIIVDNLDNIIANVVHTVVPPFKNLIKNVTAELAKSVIENTLNEQLQAYFSDSTVDSETVDGIFDNVYALLDGDGEVTVDDLTATLIGEPDPETGEYPDGILKILNEKSQEEGSDKVYTAEDVEEMTGGELVDKLNEVPGLVNTTYKVWTKDASTFETKRDAGELYVLVGEDDYQKLGAEEVFDDTEATVYYEIDKQTITNIDDALAVLLNQALGGETESSEEGETKAALKREEVQAENSSDLEKTIENLIRSKLPIDSINAAVSSFGGYAPIACLAIIGLSAFPWILFGLLTIIRTIRKNKCWTKPWIVFTLAFPQLIFGLGITYGVKFGLPYVGNYLGQYKSIIDMLTVSVKTSVYVPSIIYLAMIPLTIIYAIFAHSVKVQFKVNKKLKRAK